MRPSAIALTALLMWASNADAGGIAIETSVHGRPAETERVLRPVIAEISTRGIDARATVSAAIHRELSFPAGLASATQLLDASNNVARGYDAFIDGDCPRAMPLVESAIATFVAHPADSREDKLRLQHFRALVTLAACQEIQRAGDAAIATMAEVLRTFPERPVTTAEFAPSVVKLYRTAKAAMDRQGRGALTIRVDDPAPTIFVNERFIGTGEVALRDLVTGTYRIYLQAGAERGRIHHVKVHPGQEARLDLSWRFEAALESESYNGFAFPSEAALLRDEASLSARLARELDADTVVVLSIREVDGGRALVGSVYDAATGTLRRRGVMAIEPTEPPESKLRLLGRYLAGDDVSDPLLRTGTADLRVARASSERPGRTQRIAALSVGAAGVVATGVGLWFGSQAYEQWDDSRAYCTDANVCDKPGQDLIDDARGSATASNVLVGIGVAGIATGAILWLTAPDATGAERPERSARWRLTPIATPAQTGIVISGGF